MAINGNSDRSIIFVHECNFKPNSDEYLDILNAALCAGVEGDCAESLDTLASVNKYLAYYGDLSNEFLEKHDQFYDHKLDVSDLRSALHQLKSADRKKGFGVRKYDKLPDKQSFTEFAATVLAPILGAMGVEKKLVSRANKDLGQYWEKDSEFGSAILDRVRTTISDALDRGERILIISHGTGSIVTFDALWQLSHDERYAQRYNDSKIDVWLTLGSPLGDTMVRQQLFGADQNGRDRYPTNVLAWHNVSAEDDYVCHDGTVADDFKAMLKQRQVSSIRDYRIYNLAVRYGRSNPHSAIGYLIHPRITRIVNDWLTQSFGTSLPKSIL